METVYIMWAILGACFVVMLVVMSAREDKAARSQDSAIDPMFRRNSPSAKAQHRSTTYHDPRRQDRAEV